MKPDLSPKEAITEICARIARIEEFNGRSDACVRMRDLKKKGRSFAFIEGVAFKELSGEERQRLERARPLVARVMQRLRETLYGYALQHDLADHYRTCSGVKVYEALPSKRRRLPAGYHPTTADSQSFWKFLQGGAPGLIQQK